MVWENIVEESRRDSSNRYQWTGGVDTQEIEEAVPKNAFSFLFEDFCNKAGIIRVLFLIALPCCSSFVHPFNGWYQGTEQKVFLSI